MEPIIATPRLKLTLITTAERGSPELGWLHEIRSDEKATWWSIYGQSKSIEDTEKVMKGYLAPQEGGVEGERTYRVVYAVHETLYRSETPLYKTESKLEPEPRSASPSPSPNANPTRFIGLITLQAVGPHHLALPESLTLPAASAGTTLTLELGYQFLPLAWGKGYATESLDALFSTIRTSRSSSSTSNSASADAAGARAFFSPFEKVYMRAIVNEGNPASRRVLNKIGGMEEKGVYELNGRRVFLAGEWRERHVLNIFGAYLLP